MLHARAMTNNAIVNKLLKISEDEIDTVKILYEHEKFPWAVYALQQSIEKIAKAWFLNIGFITEKDLKRIGHITPTLFIEYAKSEHGELAVKVAEAMGVKVSRDTSDYEHFIYKDPMEYATMDYVGIKTLIDNIKNLEETITNGLQSNLLYSLLKKFIDLENYFDIPITFIWLFFLTSITFPHNQYPRYPNLNLEPWDYNMELGIVKALPELLEISNRCREDLSKTCARETPP